MSFSTVIKAITSGFQQFTWIDALDIFLIFILLYNLIALTKQTRAYGVLKGIGLLFICSLITSLIQLSTISWVFDTIFKSGTIILLLIILFQPEIRHILERIGRSGNKLRTILDNDKINSQALISDIQNAIESMSKRHVGALIVVEQKTALGDIITTGTEVDGIISGALLENIFEPNTPLHDGAVVVRGTRIAAAGCFLPLSDDLTVARELGTRHRAALGISSVSDSVTIVVSEETGAISVVRNGSMMRYLDSKALKETLEKLFLKQSGSPFWTKRKEQSDGA